MSKPLTHVFAVSLKTGVVPSDLKVAKVLPLFKEGEPSVFNNYRPISILLCFSKVLEKLVYTRVIKHFNDNNILYKHQYGFCKKHSTYMALLQLTDKISTALDKNMFAIGNFLDLSKAFDTVDHDILLSNLHGYGLQDVVIRWFSDYFSNREQYVCINGHVSKKAKLYYGVPQGSILGPLLFLIFINDFAVMSESSLPILFADDTNIAMPHSDFGCLIRNANTTLEYASRWFQMNKLSLNVNKSNFILFRNKNKTFPKQDSKLLINNTEIKQVSCTKFLGILVDERLSWGNHIEYVCKKIMKSWYGIIRRVSSLVNQSCLMTLYHSLIYPYLTYCVIVWGASYSSYLNQKLLIQKRFLRMISDSTNKAPSWLPSCLYMDCCRCRKPKV